MGEHFCGSVITHYDTFILRLQSIVGSPRGTRGICGICGCLCRFCGLQCGYKPQKPAWSAAYLQASSAHNLLPTAISNSADFSMGTEDAEGRTVGLPPRRSQRLRRLFWWYQIYRRNRRSRRAAYSLAATKVSVIRRPS